MQGIGQIRIECFKTYQEVFFFGIGIFQRYEIIIDMFPELISQCTLFERAYHLIQRFGNTACLIMVYIAVLLKKDRIPLMFQCIHFLKSLAVLIIMTYVPIPLKQVQKE